MYENKSLKERKKERKKDRKKERNKFTNKEGKKERMILNETFQNNMKDDIRNLV